MNEGEMFLRIYCAALTGCVCALREKDSVKEFDDLTARALVIAGSAHGLLREHGIFREEPNDGMTKEQRYRARNKEKLAEKARARRAKK